MFSPANADVVVRRQMVHGRVADHVEHHPDISDDGNPERVPGEKLPQRVRNQPEQGRRVEQNFHRVYKTDGPAGVADHGSAWLKGQFSSVRSRC